MNSRKGFRTITVDGRRFHWRVGGNDTSGDVPMLAFMVTPFDGLSGTLIVEFPEVWAPNRCKGSAGVVLPSHVARAVRTALVEGWRPEVHGDNFRLDAHQEEYNAPNPL